MKWTDIDDLRPNAQTPWAPPGRIVAPVNVPRGYAFGRPVWLVRWNEEPTQNQTAGYVFFVGSEPDATAHVFDDIGTDNDLVRLYKGFSSQFQLIDTPKAKGDLVRAVPCG